MCPLFETALAPGNRVSRSRRFVEASDHSRLVATESCQPKAATRKVVYHMDDDPAWRRQLADVVGTLDGIALGDLVAAQIVVVDLWHRGEDGFHIVDRLKGRSNPPQILAFTCRCDPVAVHRAVLGALDGFVWKTPAAAQQVAEALSALAQGRAYFATEFLAERRRLAALPNAYFKILSPIELKLVPLFGKHLSDEEVGRRVGLNPRTIRWHRGEIVRRLGLAGSHELPIWATVTGFVPPHLPAPPCVVAVSVE